MCECKQLVNKGHFVIFIRARFGKKKNPALLSAVESSGHNFSAAAPKVYFLIAFMFVNSISKIVTLWIRIKLLIVINIRLYCNVLDRKNTPVLKYA